MPDTTTLPTTPDELFKRLEQLNIETTTVKHPPLFTVEDSQLLRGQISGGHTKNLFLKDKKGNFFLVTVLEDAKVDLKSLHKIIGGSSRLSFGKPEKLLEYLGVLPGSVTAFSVINDTENMVKMIIDAPLMEQEIINCHPLINTATTSISRENLIKFLNAVNHEPQILNVSL
jgi:Ala-tRNA(Pro) deacylase